MTRCTRPARLWRKASSRAAASRCCAPPCTSRGYAPRTTTRRTGVEIVRKALSWPARQIAINAGRGRFRCRRQDPREGSVQLRLRLADRRICQPDLDGYYRPDQGRSRGNSERSLGCGSLDHHRSHGGRSTEEKTKGGAGMPPGGGGMGGMGGMDYLA